MSCAPFSSVRTAWLLRLRVVCVCVFAAAFASNLPAQTGGKSSGQPKTPEAGVRKNFEKPRAPVNGPPLFLTEAVDHDIDTYSRFNTHLFFPTQQKTEQPFYDIPFAVNVPFEVPFQDGIVRVFIDVNIVWDEPERAARRGDYPLFSEGGGWQMWQRGVYRLDGGSIPPERVEWEADAKRSTKMIAPPGATFPFLLNGDLPTPQNPYNVETNMGLGSAASSAPRLPFRDSAGRNTLAAQRPLVLRAVSPGWYALWFALTPSVYCWPPDRLRHNDDALHAKLYVHTIVARRERFKEGDHFTDTDLQYLWDGADLKPARPLDPKLVHAHTLELPLVLRRNGWVLSKVDVHRATNVHVDSTIADAGPYGVRAEVIKGAASPHATGVRAKFERELFERASSGQPWQSREATTFTWDIELPGEIPDGGVGEVVAKGGVSERGFAQDYWARAAAGKLGALPSWMWRPGSVNRERDPLSVSALLERVDRPSKEDYVKTWGAVLGDMGANKYFSDASNDTHPPRSPDATKRYWMYQRMFDPGTRAGTGGALRKLLYTDAGPLPLYSCSFGPWTADVYYRRKKDVEKEKGGASATATAPTKFIEEKDPFWEWYPKFSRLLNQKLLEASSLERQVALLREPLQEQRRIARRLLDAVKSTDEAHGWSDWAFGSDELRATFPDAMISRMVQQAGAANTKAESFRETARQCADQIRAAYDAILKEIDRVYDTHIDRHPQLVLWKRHYRQQIQQVDFKIAVATSDLGLFQAAIARANPRELLPEVLVTQAQLQIENGDPVGALEALRTAARQQTGSTDARDRLRDLECSFIKIALEKSHGAIADARKHFHTYLSERGMSGEKHAWVGGVHNPLSALDTEMAWAVFTTGVTGSVSALLGRAEEEARALDAVQSDMTTAYLGAQAILRLRMRKHELKEIKTMSTSRLREALMEGVTNAPQIDETGARNLGLAIHRAFQLPELVAMTSDDFVGLRIGLNKGYWDAKMVGNTWAEWVGDLSSPKNLVMTLLPMSIGRVGGQLQAVSYWSRAEAGLIQGAVREGYVDTGTMVLARMAGWDRVLGAVGATPAGERLIKLLERSQKYQESLGLFGQAGWTTGKMVATMALQGLAVHEAEQLGGPKAALLMEALLLFGGDTDLLCKFLDGARIQRHAVVMAVRQQFLPAAERQLQDLARVGGAIPEVENVLRQMKSGKSVPAAQRRPLTQSASAHGANTNPVSGARPTGSSTQPTVVGGGRGSATNPVSGAKSTGSGTQPPGRGTADVLSEAVTDGRVLGPPVDSRQAIPNGQPGNDCNLAVVAAEEGIEQGTDNGAIAAAKELQSDVAKEAEELAKKRDQLAGLSGKIESTPKTGPIPPREIGGTGKFMDQAEGGFRYPGQPGGNDLWTSAEQALREGRFAEAEELFREFRKRYIQDAQAGKKLGAQDLHIDIIEKRIEQARALQTLPPPQVNRAASEAVMRPISDAEVEAILALERRPLGHQGVSGQVSQTKGAPFVVKEVRLGGNLSKTAADLETVIEAEVIAAELRQIFGIPTPGMNVKARWQISADGHLEMISADMIYRRVPGKGLDQMTPAELYHMADQISEDRAVSMLIGDFDRKPDNYQGLAGVVHALDGGVADVRGVRAIAEGSLTHPQYISGLNGRDHWYFKSYNLLFSDNATYRAHGRQIFLSEMSLTAQPAERAIKRVEEILGDPRKRAAMLDRLRTAYRRLHRDNPRFAPRQGVPQERIDQLFDGFVDSRANEVMRAVEARLEPTKKALPALNERNGIPLGPKTGSWRGAPWMRAADNVLPFTGEERMAA